jgi:hypothetical protein
MPGRLGGEIRRMALVGAVFHALFLAAAPFEHHDLICHLKTPQHCSSCVSSPVGSHPHAHASAASPQLADAGHATTSDIVFETALLSTASTGRSPPPAI